jgi:hypothetical protein
MLLSRIMASLSGTRSRESTVPASYQILCVGLLIALWSQPGDWSRRPWSNPYHPRISELPDQPAAYFLLAKPLAYIAPLLPPQSRFYQIADIAVPIMPGGEFDRRIRAGLQNPLPGGAWELHVGDQPFRENLLERYGLGVDSLKSCVEIEGAQLSTVIEACPLVMRDKGEASGRFGTDDEKH